MFQLAKCERLYSKLDLDRPKTSLRPGAWNHILHSQSTVLDQARNVDPRDIKSAPALQKSHSSVSYVTSRSGHMTDEQDHVTISSGEDGENSIFELTQVETKNGLHDHQPRIKSTRRVSFSFQETNLREDIANKHHRQSIRNFWNQENQSVTEEDAESNKSDNSSNAEQTSDGGTRKRQHLDPDTLCDILRKRGLGDPRGKNPGPFVNPLPLLLKHQQYARRNKFYVEKLKGKSRMDFDLAATQVVAFCQQQKGGKRTASAHFRQRKESKIQNQEINAEVVETQNRFEEDDVKDDDEHEFLDEEKIQRIQSWIIDVNIAQESRPMTKKDRKIKIVHDDFNTA